MLIVRVSASHAFAAAIYWDEHDPGAFDGVLDRFQGGGAWGSGVGLEVLDGGEADACGLGKLTLRDVEQAASCPALAWRNVGLLSRIKTFWLTIGHGGLFFELSKRWHHATFHYGHQRHVLGLRLPEGARALPTSLVRLHAWKGEPCPRHFCVSRPVLL